MSKLKKFNNWGGVSLLVVTAMLMVSLSACSVGDPADDGSSKTTISSSTTATPYASLETLDDVTNNTDDYVYWRVARTFSLIELETFREDNQWYNATLSERPVLVYDAKSRPKYYEFRVVRKDEEIGAITAVAQKKDGGPINYVLPYPKDYSKMQTKAGEGFKIVANGYPTRIAYGLVTKAGDDVNVAIDENGDSTDVEQDPLETALEHPEYFTNSNTTEQMVVEMATNYIITNFAFWNDIELDMESFIVISTNDEYIAEMFKSDTKGSSKYFEGGRVVSGFGGTEDGGWWDPNYTFSESSLYWHGNPYNPYPIWCGPGAAGIALTYYGYTDRIKDGYVNDPFGNIVYTTNVQINAKTYYSSGNKQVIFEFVSSNLSSIKIDSVDDINIDLKGKGTILSSSITPISGGYRITYNIAFGMPTSDLISIDAKVNLSYPNPSQKFGIVIVKSQIGGAKSSKFYGLSMVWQNGYYNFGRQMGITDFVNEGGVNTYNLMKGIRWAGVSISSINYVATPKIDVTLMETSRYGSTAIYNKAAAGINNGDLFILDRSHWYGHDSKDDGKKGGGHWRVGVGYKSIDAYGYVLHARTRTERRRRTHRFLWWTWFSYYYVTIVERYYKWGRIRTDRWYLITDNGYEGSDTLYKYPGQRDYIKKKNSSYSGNIFWERVGTSDYSVREIILLRQK